MAYPHYTTPSGTHQTAPTTTYPYSAYHAATLGAYAHPQTPGAYPYQAAGYQTGVTGYGWTYPYGYLPQHPASALHPQRVQSQTQAVANAQTTTTTTAASTASSIPQRTSTFSSYTPSYSGAATTAGRGSRRQSNLRGLFAKELRNLMYGFGDDRNPANDTVNVMEEILIEYITDVCMQAGASSRKSRLAIEDLRKALSHPADAKKLARMEELLFMQEDIKRARAQFEDSELNNPREF